MHRIKCIELLAICARVCLTATVIGLWACCRSEKYKYRCSCFGISEENVVKAVFGFENNFAGMKLFQFQICVRRKLLNDVIGHLGGPL